MAVAAKEVRARLACRVKLAALLGERAGSSSEYLELTLTPSRSLGWKWGGLALIVIGN